MIVADRLIAKISSDGTEVERFVQHEAVDRFCATVISSGKDLPEGQRQDEPEVVLAQAEDRIDRPGW